MDHQLIGVIVIIRLFTTEDLSEDQRAHLQACKRRCRRGNDPLDERPLSRDEIFNGLQGFGDAGLVREASPRTCSH